MGFFADWRVRALLLAAGALLAAAATAADPAPAAAAPAAESGTTGHYLFRSYGAAQGLTNIGVLQLTQDAQGFIWVGTEDGLFRYDGYRFEYYGLREGLLSTSIDALHVDATGRLWVGTHAGLSGWNGQRFEPVTPEQGLPGITVWSIADAPDGLYVATAQGAYRRGVDGQYRLVADWPGGEATALRRERASARLWAARWDGDAHVMKHAADGWHEIPAPAGHVKERIEVIAQDGAGRIWARSATALWKLAPGSDAFVLEPTPLPLSSSRGYLMVGRQGDLWVSTDKGMQHLVGDRWSVIGAKEGLPGAPWPMLEDSEGSIWVGTVGLHRLLGRGIFNSYTKADGLPYDVVWSVFRDREQRLWAGTSHGVAMRTATGFATVAGTEDNTIRSIVQGPDGRLYMAGVPGNEILVYDPQRNALARHELFPDNGAKRIFRLLLDRDGMLWASTDGAGLFIADTSSPALKFSRVEVPRGTPIEYMSDVRQDARGRIWVAGQYGLAVRENGVWHRFTAHDGLRRDYVAYARPISTGEILVAYFDPLGVARVRYENGKFEVLGHLDSQTTHSADKVFIVGEDARGGIWLGGGKGYDLVTPSGTHHFGVPEGVVGEDTCAMSFLADPNGDIWTGTTQGLAHFDAAAFAALPESRPPTLSFVALNVGGVARVPDAAAPSVPYDAATFEARFAGMSYAGEGTVQYRVRLLGHEDDFHVTDSRDARYSALAPGAYRFEAAARLGSLGAWGPVAAYGFSVVPAWWQTWWCRTLAGLLAVALLALVVRWRLRALQARNRLLEEQVAARTRELSRTNVRLSESNDLLHSEINERLAAERALQQRNADLQALNEKLAGAQSQLLQSEKMASVGQLAAGVAHEINNPIGYVNSNLGTLRAYMKDIALVLERYEEFEQILPADHPQRVALAALKRDLDLEYLRGDVPNLLGEAQEGILRVQKIVRDLRDFSHLDESEWQWADLHQGLESTLGIVSHELKYKAELVREYGELPQIECLPFQLNQVFLNLLVNAVHAIPERGRITLRTGSDADGVWVQVADTGSGISPAHLPRIFEPFFTTKPVGTGTGLGLSVSYGIVQTHGGTISVESEIGVGTTFTIRLPIHGRAAAAAAADAATLASVG